MAKHMDSNGIIMGCYENELVIQPTDSSLANRNYFVVGGPGSFKTQSFIITNILNERECTVITTDPKGEVYEMTAEVKRKQGYEVHVINFDDMSHSDRWNPFDYVRKDIDANVVADTIVAAKNDSKHKDVWYNTQKDLLKAIILLAKYEFPVEDRCMRGVIKFLQLNSTEIDPDTGIAELDAAFLKLEISHPARMAYELGFAKTEGKMRSSIISSLLSTIGDYVDEEVAEFTSRSDFMLQELGKRRIALYVIIPVMKSSWEGLINLFFTQSFQELYILGASNNAKLPNPLIYYLDEFPNLGKFAEYEKFLATCRGYGIACCTVLQNITQLQDKYGKEQSESILGNCAVKLCLGNVNNTTQTYFSDLCGTTTAVLETSSSSKTSGKQGSSSSSENSSYASRKLITPDEIATMNKNDSICVVEGKHPAKLKKTKQFELFPGITKKYRISQVTYQKSTSKESEANRQQLIQEYEERKGIARQVILEKKEILEEQETKLSEEVENNIASIADEISESIKSEVSETEQNIKDELQENITTDPITAEIELGEESDFEENQEETAEIDQENSLENTEEYPEEFQEDFEDFSYLFNDIENEITDEIKENEEGVV